MENKICPIGLKGGLQIECRKEGCMAWYHDEWEVSDGHSTGITATTKTVFREGCKLIEGK